MWGSRRSGPGSWFSSSEQWSLLPGPLMLISSITWSCRAHRDAAPTGWQRSAAVWGDTITRPVFRPRRTHQSQADYSEVRSCRAKKQPVQQSWDQLVHRQRVHRLRTWRRAAFIKITVMHVTAAAAVEVSEWILYEDRKIICCLQIFHSPLPLCFPPMFAAVCHIHTEQACFQACISSPHICRETFSTEAECDTRTECRWKVRSVGVVFVQMAHICIHSTSLKTRRRGVENAADSLQVCEVLYLSFILSEGTSLCPAAVDSLEIRTNVGLGLWSAMISQTTGATKKSPAF